MDGLRVEIKSDKYYYFAGDKITFTLKFINSQPQSTIPSPHAHQRSLSVSTNHNNGGVLSNTRAQQAQLKQPPSRCGLVGKNSDPVPQNDVGIGKGRPSTLRHNRQVQSIDLSKRFSSAETLSSPSPPSSSSSPSSLSINSTQSPTRSPNLPWRHPHTRKASNLSTPTPTSSTMQDNSTYHKLNRNLKTPLLPNHEKILWATAQLCGKIELNRSLIKRSTMTNRRSSNVLGGGVLDDVKANPHKRSSTLFNFSLTNWFNHLNNSSNSNDTSNTTLSIWETRRSVLVVDKVLSPNQDTTITFQHTLPITLPPSYHGKIGKITYEFVVGTNKQNGNARVIKIPIKVLPNVTIDEESRRFDVLKPIMEINEEAIVKGGDVGYGSGADKQVVKANTPTNTPPSNTPSNSCFEKAYKYAQKLYLTTYDSMQRSSSTNSSGYDGPFENADIGTRVSEQCRTAIGISSRNSQKVTYEITKDDLNIAILSIVKSTFRLGESVLGKISINKPNTMCGKVLKVGLSSSLWYYVLILQQLSATLESHEIANENYANLNQKHTINATRKVHSEFHQPLAIDLSEIGFSLDVPSHQSSDFKTSIFEVKWIIKLSFLVIIPVIVEDPQALSPRPSIGSLDSSPLPTPILQPMPRTPFTSSSSTSTPSSPSTTNLNLGNGFCAKSVNHLVNVDHIPNSFRSQDRLGGGDGKGKEELIQCQIPLNVLPNSTDYEPELCNILL
ncbi:hypothetical protein E3P84_01725 [Wallemia ichthyophaga]|nr:hypothetical protein E3P95_01646 [Wallemia ichthyophaga]TIB01660.1 hypothetical protein E3P94_01682 [Wallemia ichthyophaga]TIB34492.1 hypothetical protein E3P84_01725 [Wallemia ichthyophaga]TIB41674.1 hypothetical protein E3P83_01749 [Wallemia ichthyophaga]